MSGIHKLLARTAAVFGALFALAFPSSILLAEEFRVNRILVIGDSLSDAGAYTQAVVAGGAPNTTRYRFTNNSLDGSGLVWTENLANTLGINHGPDVLQGVPLAGIPTVDVNGGNYAEGGSRVSQQPGVIGGLTPAQGFTTLPGTTQVDRLLADNPNGLTGSDLVAVWLGANDVFTQSGAVTGGLPVPTALANMQTAADELVAQVARLQAAGATNIIVVTVPDIGTTPFGQSTGPSGAALLTQLSNTFNQQLTQGLAGTRAVIVDSGRLLSAVQADPARFGFTSPNALVPACPASALNCINGINAAADVDTRIFADGVHPTAAAHVLFGQAGFAGLKAAAQAGAISVATLQALRQQSIGLEARLNPTAFVAEDEKGNRIRRRVGDIDKFGSIEGGYYQSDRQQVLPGISATTEVLKVGGDIMVAPNALVGGGLSLDHGQLEFDQDSGGFDSRLFVGALYGQVALSPTFYVNAAGALGYVDYYNINRSFLLGASRESYSADTSGVYAMARFGGGAMVRSGVWTFNPAASVTYEQVKVNGYTESLGAASLAFGDLSFEAIRLTGSFTATYAPADPKALRGQIRASIEYDIKDDDLTVGMGPTSNALGLVSAPRPDSSFGFLSGQIVQPLAGQSSLSALGSASVGLSGSMGFTGTLTYKANF